VRPALAHAVLVFAAAAAACRAPAEAPRDTAGAAHDEAAAARLRAHVRRLAEDIGPRCGATPATYVKLEQAALYIQSNLEMLLRGAQDRTLVVQRYSDRGKTYSNIAVEIAGSTASEIVVAGAHYDSHCGGSEPFTPGADDNATGVAVLLELASRFERRPGAPPAPLRRSLRFVAFANEESPYFQTSGMGSLLYAQECRRKGEDVRAMVSLETLGYYTDEPGSQRYPYGIDRLLGSLPERGDFLAIVGNLSSRRLMLEAVEAFRAGTPLPVEGFAAPFVPQLGWSDNWSFWQAGYPAVMVTDTALERNPHYHGAGDTWDTLDYRRLSMAADGLLAVIRQLAAGTP
jgi:Zn-dependent M28 family amino/carboxypeptidase